jgi:SAM-dependent methyltransferase
VPFLPPSRHSARNLSLLNMDSGNSEAVILFTKYEGVIGSETKMRRDSLPGPSKKDNPYMYTVGKTRNVLRRLLQSYGPSSVKRYLWNAEFMRGKWNHLQNTSDDCVYSYIEKYSNKGNILDLGCGLGSTGNELDLASFQDYIGVDISDVAINEAKTRTEKSGRAGKSHYFQSDIYSYVPNQKFDVILLRDSIYYIPLRKLVPMLERYSKDLKKGGVFIVRIWSVSDKYKWVVDILQSTFDIVENYSHSQPETNIIIFRQKGIPSV